MYCTQNKNTSRHPVVHFVVPSSIGIRGLHRIEVLLGAGLLITCYAMVHMCKSLIQVSHLHGGTRCEQRKSAHSIPCASTDLHMANPTRPDHIPSFHLQPRDCICHNERHFSADCNSILFSSVCRKLVRSAVGTCDFIAYRARRDGILSEQDLY